MEARLFELDAKMGSLAEKASSFPDKVTSDYQSKLDISWLFHDNALDGVVLSYSELKAAIDQRIISDVSLIPTYEEVRTHKQAADYLRELAGAKRPPAVDIDFIRKIYAMVTPEAGARGCPYRKENPLHRLYYHEICAPEKIGYQMRKLGEWLESPEFAALHPVVAGARVQLKLLRAYPWTKNTGKVARLLTNYILLRARYLPAIIHSIDRQRYYEALRHDNDGLLALIVESLENSIDTTTKFFDELGGLRARRAS
ncbi:MAG: Fic family protein [Deltaproteobacteria bacterium]|nr:Fic family protein [Deltaproteobacteria bacterium]